MICRFVFVLVVAALAPVRAGAHPHEWIDVAAEVLFNEDGAVEAVRQHWRFDEAFSAWALQGLDTNGDGDYSVAELEPLARENVESLAEYDFFTFLQAGDQQARFAAPTAYKLDLAEGRLTLHYTLPLAQPLAANDEVLLQVYDPEYYIAFSLPSREAVRLVGAPAGCRLEVTPAQGPEGDAAAALAAISPDQRELPPEMRNLTSGIDNNAVVQCPGSLPVIAETPATAPRSAGDTQRRAEAQRLPQVADASEPEVAAASAARRALAEPASSNTLLAGLQSGFQSRITAALKNIKTSQAAIWWLGGISFLYGVVHAAGPGHGKVVISSYLLANEARVRRGVSVAFISAFIQALVAIGLVAAMALVLNMTSMAMTNAALFLEIGSFALVAALGLYLTISKGRYAWSVLGGRRGHARHRHEHASSCAHSHQPVAGRIQWEAPEPARAGHRHACSCHHHLAPGAAEHSGLRGMLAAVVSVGLRPCSGALIVLVFALAQGVFWAGIASTFLMALGTAMTVAALATLAVAAKGLAVRFAAGGGGHQGGQVMASIEVAASLAIMLLGLGLLVGALL